MKIAIIHAAYVQPPEGFYTGGVTFDKALPLVNANFDKIFAMLRRAGHAGADLAVTHEDFGNIGSHMRDIGNLSLFRQLVEAVEGRVIGELCAIAKEYGMMIAANEYETDKENVYNTTKLIGRDSAILGKYRKVHIPSGERFQVQGGQDMPVFKTEFGNIGFAICYDFIFPEHCRTMALNGADMIIVQTQGWAVGSGSSIETGEAFMRVRAAENSVYLVVAKNNFGEGGASCIVDNLGNIVASMSSPEDNVFMTEVEPNFDLIDKYDYDNLFAGLNSIRARHLLHREPHAYAKIAQEMPALGQDFRSELLRGERMCTYEELKEIIRKLNQSAPYERSKYHW